MSVEERTKIKLEAYLAHEGLMRAPHPARLHVKKILSIIKQEGYLPPSDEVEG